MARTAHRYVEYPAMNKPVRFSSAAALRMDLEGNMTLSAAAKVALVMELLDPSYIDEDGHLVEVDPLITPEEAKKLLEFT